MDGLELLGEGAGRRLGPARPFQERRETRRDYGTGIRGAAEAMLDTMARMQVRRPGRPDDGMDLLLHNG